METTTFSILELIRNLISKDPFSTIEFEKVKMFNENDRPQATPCMQSIHSFATIASASSLVPSETSAFMKVYPKMSSSNISIQREGGGGFSESNNGANRKCSDADIPCKGKPTESERNADKSVLNDGTLAEDKNTPGAPKTGNCEVSDFGTQKDSISNSNALGKKLSPCI